jgi:DNA repair protein RadC
MSLYPASGLRDLALALQDLASKYLAQRPDLSTLSPNTLKRTLYRIGLIHSYRQDAQEPIKRLGDSCNQMSNVLQRWLSAHYVSICKTVPECHRCGLRSYCDYFSRGPRIKQLPLSERPREKLKAYGEKALSDAELLAILLGSGSRYKNALALAQELLQLFGDLRNLATRSLREISRLNGIGTVKGSRIKVALELSRRLSTWKPQPGTIICSPSEVYEYYRQRYRDIKKEIFLCLMLDNKNRVIKEEEISVGTLDSSVVIPREAFADAIRESAGAIIFIHNHPSGSKEPSQEDIQVTLKLKEVAQLVGIELLDHVIVAEEGYTSLAEVGKL